MRTSSSIPVYKFIYLCIRQKLGIRVCLHLQVECARVSV